MAAEEFPAPWFNPLMLATDEGDETFLRLKLSQEDLTSLVNAVNNGETITFWGTFNNYPWAIEVEGK